MNSIRFLAIQLAFESDGFRRSNFSTGTSQPLLFIQ